MKKRQPLISSESQFVAMAAQAPAMVWVSGPDKLAVYFNEGWLGFRGRTLHDEVGIGWFEGLHPDDAESFQNNYSSSFDARKEFQIRCRLQKHNKEFRWVVHHGVPLFSAEGDFIGYAVNCMDVHTFFRSALPEEQSVINEELQHSKQELFLLNSELEERILERTLDLAESEHRLRTIVESAPFPIGVYEGREMRIVMANKSIIEVWGKGSNIVGKRYREVLPELESQGIYEQLDRVYMTGEPYHARNQQIDLVVDGQMGSFFFNYSFTPIYDTNGHIYGVINTAADVTDLQTALQKIEKSQEELRQIDQQKDDFIGIASHELKTPLTTLTGIVQLLHRKLQDSPDPFISGAMIRANNQIKKMISLIHSFLNISRLESGTIVIESERFSINKLIKEMVEEIQMTSPYHDIIYSDCEPVTVYADHEKIGSVISNLLSNAVKYSPRGKNIEVKCVRSGDMLLTSVADEGMGIKPEDVEKIFDRYYRVESDHTRSISGFGIGLYLSAEIVKRHGGRIWLESEKGIGSTFYFTLPAAD
ncbi:PAS domain-containing sensor histidine kinase [Pedobacter faecalis]|uniref:PAS domain-containing sensor histidine kinase n=1 Tax=Pedobacter faecalis TaxID=3041495 RepID=UPI00254A11CF|nr:ATP-binding protein [Pedobacter sp. ELA7]